jgi:CRISPR-associated protein (TIGR03984 family)
MAGMDYPKSSRRSGMTNSKKLYGRTSQNITLANAIADCLEHLQEKEAIALLYSPATCQFAKLHNAGLKGAKGDTIDLDPIFEARIFNETWELRWLNIADGLGSAVLISESDISKCLGEPCDLDYLETLPQQYILWGEGMARPQALAEGWSRLAAARIGAMDVPFAGVTQHTERLLLQVREYLKEVDDYGNVAVVEERLMKLTQLVKSEVNNA